MYDSLLNILYKGARVFEARIKACVRLLTVLHGTY